WLRGKPEVEALAATLERFQPVQQNPLHLVGEGRIEVRDAGQGDADPWRDHGLMRATFWREAHARRGGGDDEFPPRIEGVVERVETTRDERIVQGADREQRYAGKLLRLPQRAQRQEEVVLGDAQLDVLALWRLFPLHGLRRPFEEIGL